MQEKCTEYFASRNGFDGFTSYFKDVFSPTKYTKIFILKGGPGTGKSTLMKRLCEAFSKTCDKVDRILCSSDVNSLDGLILEKNGRRIAFIDGTAPHITDPTLPVACEEIINLENAISEGAISKHRTTLEKLYQKKQNEYTLAYHFLLVCGEISRNYSAVCNVVDEGVEKDNLYYLLDNLPYVTSGASGKRLYTAFGKDGFFEFQSKGEKEGRVLNFNRSSEFARLLVARLKKQNSESTFILNCFDGGIDKITIPSLSLTLSFGERKEIDPSLLSIYTEAMEISREHFAEAALNHFRMEDIYREALQFGVLDEIFLALKEKAKVLLSIS